MTKARLRKNKELPDDYHVARYCRPYSVKTVKGGSLRKVLPRAFENRLDDGTDVSFSVMEYFDRSTDEELIWEVCKHRGNLIVRQNGHYVKLNVGRIRETVYKETRFRHRFLFKPGKNPAHANLFARELNVAVALSSLANHEGTVSPVPNPIPDPPD